MPRHVRSRNRVSLHSKWKSWTAAQKLESLYRLPGNLGSDEAIEFVPPNIGRNSLESELQSSELNSTSLHALETAGWNESRSIGLAELRALFESKDVKCSNQAYLAIANVNEVRERNGDRWLEFNPAKALQFIDNEDLLLLEALTDTAWAPVGTAGIAYVLVSMGGKAAYLDADGLFVSVFSNLESLCNSVLAREEGCTLWTRHIAVDERPSDLQ